jgi:hypothetical protein
MSLSSSRDSLEIPFGVLQVFAESLIGAVFAAPPFLASSLKSLSSRFLRIFYGNLPSARFHNE